MRKLSGKRLLSIALGLILTVSMAAFFVSCNNVQKVPEECTITFETYGGTAVDPIVVAGGEMAEKPENPTKSGHVFKGWYLDPNNTEGGSFMFGETPITEDITLHAVWQIRRFIVTFKTPEGEEIEGIGGTTDWGTLLEKPDETAFQKEGYLLKWYTDSGSIWDFETSRVTTNTTLTYQYVSTKDTYNGAEIAENFYPSFNRGDLSPENSAEHFNGGTSVYYTYSGTQLQQAILNVELKTMEYTSVTVKMRSVGFTVNEETGEYTFDAANGGTFSQVRGYILTDVGGHLSFNDKGASGYDPVNYYIQSTGTNKELYSQKTLEDGWIEMTFDVAALKYWQDGETLYGFGIGYVSTSKAVEIESVVFNAVDKTQEFTVNFTDRIGTQLAESQTLVWNTPATKPAKLEDGNGVVYTGEWLDASGEVFDFSKGIRSNMTLTPQYTINGKYSWTGTEVAKDLYAVLNEDKTLPAIEYALNGNSGYTFNNGAGNSCKQVGADGLELAIGNYKYLVFKLRIIDNKNVYVENATLSRIRIYLETNLGGNAFDKDLEGAENFYYDFQAPSASEVTTPIDLSAKFEGGWYVVTIDMTALPYYANGTTVKGFSLGVVCGDANGLEIAEVYFAETVNTDATYTVSFVDENGDAIEGLAAQTVPYGKSAAMPDSSLVPAKADHAFDCWVDENGEAFNFGLAITESVVLKPAYVESWEGKNYTLKGQQIVDNLTASYERYGVKGNVQKAMSLNESGEAYFDFAPLNKPNMVATMLNAGIRVHEGSKLVVTFKSTGYPTYTLNRVNLCIAFRGQDPATQITNTNTDTYYQVKDIAFGTMQGTYSNVGVSFVTAEDGTHTATFDLYFMQQAYAAKGITGEGVNLSYIDAFSFMIVETNTAAKAVTSKSTFTYTSFEFINVQMEKGTEVAPEEGGEEGGNTEALVTKTLKGQQIVDAFTASYERYGNTLEKQNALSVDGEGNAYYAYEFGKANKTITMLNANVGVREGSKLVLKFKSSAKAEGYHITQAKIGFAFKGEDPATTIHNKGTNAKYYNVSGLISTDTAVTNDAGTISYSIDENGIVTVVFDLYALKEASLAKVTAGADVNIIDAFTLLIVESNDDTKTNTANNSTITYYSVEFQNVVL